MKNLFLTCIFVLTLFSLTLAQLSGPLSGVITSGIYTVLGEISVEDYDSLTIEPGVTLEFMGPYEFNIEGYVYAAGTETDSIKFIPGNGVNYWSGINFNYTYNNGSRFEYCLITGGHSPIGLYAEYGGGIFFYHSNPEISKCTITGNSADQVGGGARFLLFQSDYLRLCYQTQHILFFWRRSLLQIF